MLRILKTETAGIAKSPYFLIVYFSQPGLAGIFYYKEVMLFRYLHYFYHIGRQSEDMDRHDCPCSGCDFSFNFGRDPSDMFPDPHQQIRALHRQ